MSRRPEGVILVIHRRTGVYVGLGRVLLVPLTDECVDDVLHQGSRFLVTGGSLGIVYDHVYETDAGEMERKERFDPK